MKEENLEEQNKSKSKNKDKIKSPDELIHQLMEKAGPELLSIITGEDAKNFTLVSPLPKVEFDLLPDLIIKNTETQQVLHFILESNTNKEILSYCLGLGSQYAIQNDDRFPQHYVYYLGEEKFDWFASIDSGSLKFKINLIEVFLKPIPDDLPDVVKKFAELLYENKGVNEDELLLKMRELFYSDSLFEKHTIVDDFVISSEFDDAVKFNSKK